VRTTRLGGLILAGALTAGVLLVAVDPASAGGNGPVPDLKISKSKSGPFRKNDVYNSSGNGQAVTKTAPPGATRKFYLKVQNDGSDPVHDNIGLSAPPGFGCFQVRFYGEGFDSNTNVTSNFNSGFGQTIAPGKTRKWRIEITATNACVPGQSQGTVTTGEDNSGVPFDEDAVRTELKVV
jgi:hypothetical protein